MKKLIDRAAIAISRGGSRRLETLELVKFEIIARSWTVRIKRERRQSDSFSAKLKHVRKRGSGSKDSFNFLGQLLDRCAIRIAK